MLKKSFAASCSIISLFAFTNVNAAETTIEGSNFKETSPTSMEAVNTVEAQAKVTAVDQKKRTMTLQTQDGKDITLHVGDEVRNFKQIKKGDMLRVAYINSLAWEIKQDKNAPVTVTEESDITRAAPGQKPGGLISEKITATGVVTKLDKKSQSVTVQGPRRTVVLQIPKPEIFSKIKVGDKIEATFTEAMAVSIETVKK